MSFLSGFDTPVDGLLWGDIMEDDGGVPKSALKTVTARELQALAEDSRDGLNLLFKQTMSSVRADANDAKAANNVSMRVGWRGVDDTRLAWSG